MAACARYRSKAVRDEPDRHGDAPIGRSQPCVHTLSYDRLTIVHSSSAVTDLRGRPLPFLGAVSSAPSDGLTDLGRPRPFFTGASTSSSASVATDLRGRPLAFFADGASTSSASSSMSVDTDLRGRPLAFFADGASTSSTSSTFSSAGSDLRGRPLTFFGATSTSASSSASATGAAFFGRPRPFFGVASSVLAAAAFLPFLAAGFSASSSSAASVLAGRPRFLPVGFFSSPSSSSA